MPAAGSIVRAISEWNIQIVKPMAITNKGTVMTNATVCQNWLSEKLRLNSR
jgi:hypothetical protein